jgi:hypothetical protein
VELNVFFLLISLLIIDDSIYTSDNALQDFINVNGKMFVCDRILFFNW